MRLNKKAYIITNGCPENRIDASRVQQFLQQNGYLLAESIFQADLIIFNACALTQHSANASIRMIKRIKLAKKESAQLIVCGCLTKIDQQLLRTVYQGPVFGSGEIEKLSRLFKLGAVTKEVEPHSLVDSVWEVDPRFDSYIDRYLIRHMYRLADLIKDGPMNGIIRCIERYRAKFSSTVSVDRPGTFCIKICSGCLGNCSFCAVRISRGRLKSKPLEKVLRNSSRA